MKDSQATTKVKIIPAPMTAEQLQARRELLRKQVEQLKAKVAK